MPSKPSTPYPICSAEKDPVNNPPIDGCAPDPPAPTRRELLKLCLSERDDPAPFYARLAERTADEFVFPLDGQLVLDLGSGPGHSAAALRTRGADVIAVDWNGQHTEASRSKGVAAARGDATRLPFADSTFDGVFCSNLLEHVPSSEAVLDEVERTLVPGGWGWVSWTNWYSPWGGHHITPFHYLGPKLGSRTYERLRGVPPKNRIYDGLWPTYIGSVLADVRRRPSIEVLDVLPRYYQAQRWITRIPVAREVLTWNCLILLRKRSAADH